jgi:hypothetical protein
MAWLTTPTRRHPEPARSDLLTERVEPQRPVNRARLHEARHEQDRPQNQEYQTRECLRDRPEGRRDDPDIAQNAEHKQDETRADANDSIGAADVQFHDCTRSYHPNDHK